MWEIWYLIKIACVGLIVGLLARFILPGKDPMGLIMTAVIGIAGSFLGTLVLHYVLKKPGHTAGWLLSIAGAVLLVWLYRMVAGRSRT